jgi:RimJ/RimL family protein N-acetyltransferase
VAMQEVYIDGQISIETPDVLAVRLAPKAADVAPAVDHWLALVDDLEVYYFSIYSSGTLVGQILLHDIDLSSGTSLVAYHLFLPDYRGQGIGTRALRLLQEFVHTTLGLHQLIIITSRDNVASQRLAEKCGFVYSGPSREDPVTGLVYTWNVPIERQP